MDGHQVIPPVYTFNELVKHHVNGLPILDIYTGIHEVYGGKCVGKLLGSCWR